VSAVARIQNLVVRYGRFTALDGLTCEVAEGATGLLGPNGAGKTTLLKTLLGFITPTSGSAEVLGLDAGAGDRRIRQQVGLMPEQDCHIPGMSAVQFVSYAGELAGMPSDQAMRRAHEVLEYCGLGEARYRNVETYSTGMKQRIKLAQAIVHGPKLLLLDEPTNGLDPAGREDMLDLVRSVSHGKGLHVLVSSHVLPDIERICDRVLVIMAGRLRASGTIKDLKRIESRPVDLELREASPAFVVALQARGAAVAPPKFTTYRVHLPGRPEDVIKVVLAAARESGAQIRGFAIAERSLEEAFLDTIAPASTATSSIGSVPPLQSV
jgi:ABC-2 type transport system ATP-binding protein